MTLGLTSVGMGIIECYMQEQELRGTEQSCVLEQTSGLQLSPSRPSSPQTFTDLSMY